MQIKMRLLIIALVPLFSFGQQISIIPKPAFLEQRQGDFVIDNNTALLFNKSNTKLQLAANFFRAYVSRVSGIQLMFNEQRTKTITLTITNTPEIGTEGYQLDVAPSTITIVANTEKGILYAMQSIFQTLPAIRTNEVLKVPAMEVIDYPRFGWRGMHLDVSRHFFSVELVKQYIDLMAQYKLNTFHWHLVDDPGWRLQIKKYPKLTDVGAWRVDHTDKVWEDRPQAKPGETPTYGGYYTQQQIKEIIEYAARRNVTIVPEIEMPGHVASAIAAYPNLSCKQQPQLPLTGGNYTNIASNYCAGNDSVFMFLENVLAEVIALFPSRYIHIGGDEVDKTPWKNCAKCQARMKTEGLKSEEELQSYFIKRIEKFLVSKGRKMIGWDEILEGGLAPEATVMSWRGEAGGIEAAKMGHDVIMTPGNPLYFDHYQGDPATEPLAIGGFNTLRSVYEYNPVPDELDARQQKHVLGAQANLWAEYITTPEQVLYMVLPRMLALAEISWSPGESREWNNFNMRLQPHFLRFEQLGLHHSRGNMKVDIKPTSENGQLMVTLATEAYQGKIYYTTNGNVPTLNDNIYAGPIRIDSSLTLSAVTAVNGRIMSKVPAQQSFVMHKAIGRTVNYRYPVSRHYMADGPNSLTDGVRGTTAVGKFWHGFSGTDLVATIDLGNVTDIHTISLECLQHYKDWIMMPQWVKFELSMDGVHFNGAETVKNTVPVDEKEAVIKVFTAPFSDARARYIRVTAKTIDGLPPGHPGAGKPAWIFADEIVVE